MLSNAPRLSKSDELGELIDTLAPGVVSDTYKTFRKSDNIDDRRGENFKVDPNRSAEEKALDGTYLLDDLDYVPELTELGRALGGETLERALVEKVIQRIRNKRGLDR